MSENIVNRIRLLMEYDVKKTSTENISEVNKKSSIQEQAKTIVGFGDDLLKGIAPKTAAQSAARVTSTLSANQAQNVFVVLGDDVITALSKQGVNSGDDLAKAMKAGTIQGKEASVIYQELAKDITIPLKDKVIIIDDIVAKRANKFKGMTPSQIRDNFKLQGFPDDVATRIGNKMAAANKTKLGTTAAKTTGDATKATTTGTKKVATSATEKITADVSKKGTADFYRLRKARLRVRRPTGPKSAGLTRGLASRVYTAVRTYSWTGFLIWGLKLGLTAAALYYLWKWFTGGPPEDEDGNVVPAPPKESKYRDCSTAEVISLGCKSDKIRKLQGCIGVEVDGAWGPKTQARMEQLGLGSGILVSDIDQICKTSEDAQQDAQDNIVQQNTPNKLDPQTRGSEASIDFSSGGSGSNIDVSASLGSTEDFS